MYELEENNRRGKTRDLFKKIGDIKGTFLLSKVNKQNNPNQNDMAFIINYIDSFLIPCTSSGLLVFFLGNGPGCT